MNDWKAQLREAAAVLREQQKNKKSPKSKIEVLSNFKGKKGFSDVGIALTEKTIKQKRKNKASYRSSNYEFSRLKLINDQRAADAKARRLANPNTKRQVDTLFKIADERIEKEDKKIHYQNNLDRIRNRDPFYYRGNSYHLTGKSYAALAGQDKGSVELDPYAVDAARSSVINQDPEFKNKIEEDIWRLKNKK